jgi:glycosyltransferase involved in cell wall biosynthesis
MISISVNILTHNRVELLKKALSSIIAQSFQDFEIVLVDDGSSDGTQEAIEKLKIKNLRIIKHEQSAGIAASRQEALLASDGEYIAILDDDDEWVDQEKLKKQVEYFQEHPDAVLVGGGIRIESRSKDQEVRMRPQLDKIIRRTMLFKNNFFTSTVMFRRQAAIEAGGFTKDGDDLAEDYDLWLRLGQKGQMHNFYEVFAGYRQSSYNKGKFKEFLNKQSRLIKVNRRAYPYYLPASAILKIRALI